MRNKTHLDENLVLFDRATNTEVSLKSYWNAESSLPETQRSSLFAQHNVDPFEQVNDLHVSAKTVKISKMTNEIL